MSDKPTLLLMAPVATLSGYGARSRDIAWSLIKSQKYNVKIWNTRWGTTPMNALSPDNPKHKAILDCLMTEPKLEAQPEIFVQITVPNEFQQIGKYNIGITAGIETTIASAPWIEGCNRMDLVLTSSQHSKKVFEESVWEQRDQNGNSMGVLKLQKPIEVLFEGVDLDTYFATKDIHKSVDDELKQVKEDFAFLFVGHWLNGEFGEDRKNVSAMIRVFLEAFKNKSAHNQPALILKTSQADFSPLDRDDLLKKIEQIYQSLNTNKSLPNVYLLHGDLSDDEMNSLYNHPKIKAHLTFTKGEGYGRPLAEASLSQKIIIAPNWSGHVDFLSSAVMLPGQLTNVHPSAAWENVLLQESQWFSVDFGYAAGAMKDIVDNYKNYTQIAKKQSHYVKTKFSFDAMHNLLHNILDTRVPEFPKQVQLKLPQLKKIELPKLKKV